MSENTKKIHSLEPIISTSCTRLILGSMPSETSLQKEEYYAFPQNAFWRILFSLYESPLTDDYAEKQHFLLSHHIALWDVISSCQREGSLDSRIKDLEPNDFKSLFIAYPSITRVFFNGKKAYDVFKKEMGFNPIHTYTYLPSTSPAHAVSFEKKLEAWRVIL
ncbi:MAG: DNA-deoxyinosine glycosylase [Eubacteriales bacterium]